ncbi:MAG TPA: DUF2249 domain-containing protein [Solirubrobacteraceae bacterium]|nr:DUF2249 domain-containing protein [Solirubrobacteraceae bacterium]
MSTHAHPDVDSPVRAPGDDLSSELARLLIRALRLLKETGAVDPACQLAAQAWRVTHHAGHRSESRFTGLLHFLTQTELSEGDPMPEHDQVLDVRQEIPARRHELIFDTYGALPPGDGFVLVNDHDPKPLYYQFAAEHPNQFEWSYLEQGPQVWRVRIGRPTVAPARSATEA